jgi:hypothetical protein
MFLSDAVTLTATKIGCVLSSGSPVEAEDRKAGLGKCLATAEKLNIDKQLEVRVAASEVLEDIHLHAIGKKGN